MSVVLLFVFTVLGVAFAGFGMHALPLGATMVTLHFMGAALMLALALFTWARMRRPGGGRMD